MRRVTLLAVVGLLALLLATAAHPVPFGRVDAGSMAPTLVEGDRFVALPPALVGGVEPGDIAVYRGTDGWTVHRVLEVRDEVALTAGDANVVADQQAGDAPVPLGAIVGVVPTLGSVPLAAGVSMPGPTPAVIGGLLGAVMAVGSDRRGRRPALPSVTPVHVGALGAGAVLASWVLRTQPGAGDGSTVTNTGVVPVVAIGEHAGAAAVVWPGQTQAIAASTVRTVPGWLPPSVLETTAAAGPHTVLLAVTAVVALGLTATASTVWRTVGP